ncbi:MAG: lipoprotein signal peptidase [Flavobacteriaceae bacterium]|jgi:signal peptidase II
MTHKKALWLILAILVLDQCSKVYIKLNYPLTLYGSDAIVDWGWFRLLFIENKGMAWGAKISDFLPFISEDTGKLMLTIFRVGAVSVIGYLLWDALNKMQHKLLLVAGSLIFAGAVGNIIDSLFYGLLFSDSYGQIAEFLPADGGYAPLFFGHVVDMLQFPMFTWVWPEWLPWIGGDSFTFFRPVFNLADTAISTGVGIVLVFNKKIFPKN